MPDHRTLDAIEKVDSRKRREDQYAYLFEIQQRIEANHDIDVENIVEKICRDSRDNQWRRKASHLDSRWLSQDYQTMTKEQQIAIIESKKSTLINSAGVVCQVISAIAGSNHLVAGVSAAFGKGCEWSAQRIDQVNRSKEDFLGHAYNRTGTVINDHAENARSAEQEHNQDQRTIDEMWNRNQRLAELVLGGQ